MKTFIQTVLIILVAVSIGFAQDKYTSTSKIERNDNVFQMKSHYGKFSPNLVESYAGSIPNTSNFCDYMTNGVNLNQLWMFGDTILVSYFASDSSDALGATTRVAYYIYSLDGGATWTDIIPLQVLPDRSAYPDMSPYLSGAERSLIFSGRKYTGSSSRGGVWAEVFFGLGVFASFNVPTPGRDYFGIYQNNSFYGGMYSSPDGNSNDTLYYVKFNIGNNTFTNKTQLAKAPTDINQNVRYRLTTDVTGNNVFGMWWDNTPGAQKLKYVTSTNSGISFSSIENLQIARGLNGTINGDTCSPWFGYDALYKPGTSQWYAAWSTQYPIINSGQNGAYPQGCKILIASPGINGGLPVEVAGRTNMTLISDTNLFYNRAALQAGVTPVSHPSIAFSSNGSRMVCTFSAFQPGDSLDGFNFNDIYITYSDNNGLNWSTPVNLTNTPDWDELYPTLSETGNTPTSFKVKFIATRGPGASFFNDNAPVYRVYQVLRTFNPQNVGINNVSTEIPKSVKLYQNYPNPFNPVTKIKFEVPQGLKSGFVTLKVYNVLGKEISTVVNEVLSPGVYETDFDGSGLSSGVYFYKITADNFVETKRMTLVK